jgi:histidine ammonia-lyase
VVIALHNRSDFGLANFAAVSRGGAAIRLTADARARMNASHAALIRFIDTEPTPWVYGVTGTVMSGREMILTPLERRAQIRRPVAAGAVLFGEPIPERIVRGVLFCRLSNFIEGHAAVRADVALAVTAFDALRLAAERAIGAVTDNPVVVGEGESIRILANGGFFDADAPAIFDDFAGVCGDLTRLLEKLATRLAETADLATLPRPAQARLRGLVSALAGYAEDVTATASRTPVPGTDGGGAPQNDLISPVMQAWAKQTVAIDLLSSAVAVLRAVAACVQGDINMNPLGLDQVLRERMVSVTNLELSLE